MQDDSPVTGTGVDVCLAVKDGNVKAILHEAQCESARPQLVQTASLLSYQRNLEAGGHGNRLTFFKPCAASRPVRPAPTMATLDPAPPEDAILARLSAPIRAGM